MGDTSWFNTEWSWRTEALKCPGCAGPITVRRFIPERGFLFGFTLSCRTLRSPHCPNTRPLIMHLDPAKIPVTEYVQHELENIPPPGEFRCVPDTAFQA